MKQVQNSFWIYCHIIIWVLDFYVKYFYFSSWSSFCLKTINGSVRNRVDIFSVYAEICNAAAECWADKKKKYFNIIVCSVHRAPCTLYFVWLCFRWTFQCQWKRDLFNHSWTYCSSLFDYVNFWFFIITTFVNDIPKA